MTQIQTILYAHRDPAYADFIARLIPNLPKESFIGIRSPEYRKIKKELPGEDVLRAFKEALPHRYYEENVLHGILLCGIRDFDACVTQVERFLPYVDNWAVCDGLNPPVFKNHLEALREKVPVWIASDAPYTRRFGMHMLMTWFLDEHFDPLLLRQPAELRSDEYYVNMMTAWLFAEALAKQWDAAVGFIEQRKLDKWTHNKAIQKAIESYRIPDERKNHLRALRVR